MDDGMDVDMQSVDSNGGIKRSRLLEKLVQRQLGFGAEDPEKDLDGDSIQSDREDETLIEKKEYIGEYREIKREDTRQETWPTQKPPQNGRSLTRAASSEQELSHYLGSSRKNTDAGIRSSSVDRQKSSSNRQFYSSEAKDARRHDGSANLGEFRYTAGTGNADISCSKREDQNSRSDQQGHRSITKDYRYSSLSSLDKFDQLESKRERSYKDPQEYRSTMEPERESKHEAERDIKTDPDLERGREYLASSEYDRNYSRYRDTEHARDGKDEKLVPDYRNGERSRGSKDGEYGRDYKDLGLTRDYRDEKTRDYKSEEKSRNYRSPEQTKDYRDPEQAYNGQKSRDYRDKEQSVDYKSEDKSRDYRDEKQSRDYRAPELSRDYNGQEKTRDYRAPDQTRDYRNEKTREYSNENSKTRDYKSEDKTKDYRLPDQTRDYRAPDQTREDRDGEKVPEYKPAREYSSSALRERNRSGDRDWSASREYQGREMDRDRDRNSGTSPQKSEPTEHRIRSPLTTNRTVPLSRSTPLTLSSSAGRDGNYKDPRLLELDSTVASLRGVLSQRDTEMEDLRAANRSLHNELRQARTSPAPSGSQEADKRINELIREKENMATEMWKLKQALEKAASQKEAEPQEPEANGLDNYDPNNKRALTRKIEDLESQLRDLQEVNEATVASLQQVEKDQGHKQLATSMKYLEDDNKRLRSQVDRLSSLGSEQEHLQRDVERLREDLRTLRDKNHTLVQDNIKLTEHLRHIEMEPPHLRLENSKSMRQEEAFERDTFRVRGQKYNGDQVKVNGYTNGNVDPNPPPPPRYQPRSRDHSPAGSTVSDSTAVLMSAPPSGMKQRNDGAEEAREDPFGSRQSELTVSGYRAQKEEDVVSGDSQMMTKLATSAPPHSLSLRTCSPKPQPTQHNKHAVGDMQPYDDGFAMGSRRPFSPRTPSDLQLGDIVKFSRQGGKISRGVVKYVGHLPGKHDTYCGLELEHEMGKHDGVYDEQRYFQCKPNKGVFVAFSKVVMAWGK